MKSLTLASKLTWPLIVCSVQCVISLECGQPFHLITVLCLKRFLCNVVWMLKMCCWSSTVSWNWGSSEFEIFIFALPMPHWEYFPQVTYKNNDCILLSYGFILEKKKKNCQYAQNTLKTKNTEDYHHYWRNFVLAFFNFDSLT